MTAPTFTKTSPPASGVSLTPIDTTILKLVRGGTLPAVGTLVRNGVSLTMIDTRPLRWHQGSSGVGPANTVAPAVTGTTTSGSTLSCSTGTWTGDATITYAYQWKWADTNTTIIGATSSTYVLASGDVGHTVKCVVTATNTTSSASANSNTTATVTSGVTYLTLNPAHTEAGVTLSNGNLTATGGGGGLTAANGSGWTTGKHYMEAHMTNAGSIVEFGIGDSTGFGHLPGNGDSNSAGYYSNGGGSITGASWTTGDTIGMAVDTNGTGGLVRAWWSKNGVWQNGDPTSTSGVVLTGSVAAGTPVWPMFYISGGDVVVMNFGASAFTYTPPTGFSAP